MSGAIDRFTEAARALGLHKEARWFPEGTKTAADAARAIECGVGQAAAGPGAARRATPEEARAATGFAVGGTPPTRPPPCSHSRPTISSG